MGVLTTYLQEAFRDRCPAGWTCRSEVQLLSPELRRTLGYAPRVDVLLEHIESSRRLWVEFEISRADPVANHAKFATAHLFNPQPSTDAFVAMVSPHVTRGRRNLASNMVEVMRTIGMRAYQTVLFPYLTPNHVKQLNHLDITALRSQHITIDTEIERALLISEPALTSGRKRIHFAGDLLDVTLNIRQWNAELATPLGQQLWARRTVTYFAYDPVSQSFAPSKYCAYIAVDDPSQQRVGPARAIMTLELYVTLDGTDSRFDGNRAWLHLKDGLGMRAVVLEDAESQLAKRFRHWAAKYEDVINLHPAGPCILVPPIWF